MRCARAGARPGDRSRRHRRELAASGRRAEPGSTLRRGRQGRRLRPRHGDASRRLSAAAGCRLFFVATLDEGIALRHLLPTRRDRRAERAAARHRRRVQPRPPHPGAQRSRPDRRLARAAPRTRALPAMIHVDTGMARLGLGADEHRPRSPRDPALLAGFELRAIISHLACADEPTHPLNARQLARFPRRAEPSCRRRRRASPPPPASFSAPTFHFDFVRPGAALYGVNPTPGHPNPMAQVVRLKGKILQVRDVDRGDSVGYGAAHRMERAGRIATVAVGYADGWLRSASHRGTAGIAGQRAPVVGRISMDLMTLDVTAIDPALTRAGAFVDLIDEHLRRRRGRGQCRHHRLRDSDRARPPLSSHLSRRGRLSMLDFLARDRPRLPLLPGRRRAAGALRAQRAQPLPAPAVLSAPHRAADDRHRLLLAAGGGLDRALHRRGAGAADAIPASPASAPKAPSRPSSCCRSRASSGR